MRNSTHLLCDDVVNLQRERNVQEGGARGRCIKGTRRWCWISVLQQISLLRAYLPSSNSSIQMGGTAELPLGTTTASNSSQLAPFAGYLDEVSFYGRPLSDAQVVSHHFYGSSERQPIWIVTDAVDGIGMGVIPNVMYPERDSGFEEETIVDWDMVQQSTLTVGNTTAIQFQWNGYGT